ncbi:type IV toxin-antitoxin system AbiEi family antitoxin domain-containing protein [Propionibacterium freudenreichii]|nr:type IV toxin-antitoxin system AbiEi family antitoxin domain-containing protein [Propionibacterium freudenreichii]
MLPRQGGCLTWTQCAAHGLTRSAINRLLAASWTRTASGIYCIHPPD